MIINTRVRLGDSKYYISCNLEYKSVNGETLLCLKDYKDSYFDGGDLYNLIRKIESEYTFESYKKYFSNISFLGDCLYIYDNIPFISSVGNIGYSSDNTFNTSSSLSKEELDDFIKNNNIKMKDNSNFKLGDERTWQVCYNIFRRNYLWKKNLIIRIMINYVLFFI